MLDLVLYAVGDALRDRRDIEPIPHFNMQRNDQTPALLRDGHALGRQAAGAQGAAHHAFRRVLPHSGNAVALLGRLLRQTGKIVVGQRDMSVRVGLIYPQTTGRAQSSFVLVRSTTEGTLVGYSFLLSHRMGIYPGLQTVSRHLQAPYISAQYGALGAS